MEHLTYSLWFTLVVWIFYIGIGIIKSIIEPFWEVNSNMLLYLVGLPAVAILLEYLIARG